jgi:aminoglycoside 6'-N-acetyltransferase I
MTEFVIRQAHAADRVSLAEMRALLWPDASFEEHLKELDAIFNGCVNSTLPSAIFVSQGADGALTGFLETGLRSHADGCDPSLPVGFVEGWFVRDRYRNRGVGAALMRATEEWARSLNCLEMASDALIDNNASVNAHQALGFEIVDRCVHFRKSLRAAQSEAKGDSLKSLAIVLPDPHQ